MIYNGERESNGRYTFAAHLDGEYKYCFSNRMSTVTPKEVMFSIDIAAPVEHPAGSAGAAAGAQPPASTYSYVLFLQTTLCYNSCALASIAGDNSHEKLEEKVNELSLSLTSVKHEQEYMEVRDRVHRSSMSSNLYSSYTVVRKDLILLRFHCVQSARALISVWCSGPSSRLFSSA